MEDPSRSSFWDDAAITPLGSRCPDGLWALVPGFVPGRDEFERRRREGERADLAASFAGRRFRITQRVELGDYDFARRRFPATVEAPSSCRGDGAVIRFALGRARVDERREREGTVIGIYREWVADPIRTHIPMAEDRAPELVRAPDGVLGALRGPPALMADIVFEVASARLDRRMHRDEIGETDIGAGPLIQGRVVAMRITNTRSREVLLDTAPDGGATP